MDKYLNVRMKSFADKLGRLAKGIWDIPGTDIIRFIHRSYITKGRSVTYGHICVNYFPQKKDPNHIILTVGGDQIHYPWYVSTSSYDISTSRIHLKSVISTPDEIFITINMTHFYLGTPMKCTEYMRLPNKIIPQEIICRYNLKELEEDGYIYCEIFEGMCGLS